MRRRNFVRRELPELQQEEQAAIQRASQTAAWFSETHPFGEVETAMPDLHQYTRTCAECHEPFTTTDSIEQCCPRCAAEEIARLSAGVEKFSPRRLEQRDSRGRR